MTDTRALSWLRLVALCPLASIGLGFVDALLLGAVLAIALLAVDIGQRSLRRWLADDQQPIVAALLAAIATSASDLLLQTICHAHAQVLQPFLALPIVAAVLFCRIEATPSKWTGTLNTILRGAAFTAALCIGAALHVLLPTEAGIAASLIASGLLLAIIERSTPDGASSEASASTPRTRARVTGPLR
jgi:Na+-translocating ferredoxin:NAD+ oxidoreductase RnfE subunit